MSRSSPGREKPNRPRTSTITRLPEGRVFLRQCTRRQQLYRNLNQEVLHHTCLQLRLSPYPFIPYWLKKRGTKYIHNASSNPEHSSSLSSLSSDKSSVHLSSSEEKPKHKKDKKDKKEKKHKKEHKKEHKKRMRSVSSSSD